ncbi:MAG: helix-turn-helix domain-containing protein, partial [Bacteroidota bacterium]
VNTLNILIVIAFFYFSYHGVRHYSLETIPQNPAAANGSVEAVAVAASSPPDEKSQQTYQSLVRLFEETQIFKQPQLKLSDVAEQMDIPSHQLSQIINANHGKPFYDFVAQYRVNLLKQQLQAPENNQFTILSLGLECGFNSKASLNRVFKEQTGLTPSQYQKSHLAK